MKLIIILVGLPARGKSFISNKLSKYLNWCNIKTKIFNVGKFRREKYNFSDSSFFDSLNDEYNQIRLKLSMELYDNLLNWLKIDNNNIGIFDATNTDKNKRKLLFERTPKNINLLFIESICDDEVIIHKNIVLKEHSNDYKNNNINFYEDFKYRIKLYNNIYETIDKSENLNFIKIYNISEQIVLNLNKQISNYDKIIINNLLNININRKKIYLSRHGQSLYNLNNLIGGNSDLSNDGLIYANKLSKYINSNINNYKVYCSTLIRTINTAKCITSDYKIYKCLDEINAGICENKTYEEIKKLYPEEYSKRKFDKLNYRYPSGESYIDLIDRLKDFIYNIENNDKIVIIIGHQAILRIIYGYLMDIDIINIPHINMPLHTLIELRPNTYNFSETYINI